MLDDERLITLRQVACERHAIGERRCVDRLCSIIPQFFEQALAECLERRTFALPAAGPDIDAGAGVGADDEMLDDDSPSLVVLLSPRHCARTRARSPTLSTQQHVVSEGLVGDGDAEEGSERGVPGAATVEAEDELVEIGLKGLVRITGWLRSEVASRLTG
jgi:hypothetical protein